MSSIDELAEQFKKFPGIGPRQAKRFVYSLLMRDKSFLDTLAKNISELKDDVSLCTSCFRFFVTRNSNTAVCTICSNSNRDISKLMLVEKDVDLENIEKSGSYTGHYFVLGGSVPVLEKEPDKRVRSTEIKERIEKDAKSGSLKEIILALSNNQDGDSTVRFLNELLTPYAEKYQLKISTLGRGLSTGSELEYSDGETIKNALQNRH